jgi:DNA polymerase III subunit delta'
MSETRDQANEILHSRSQRVLIGHKHAELAVLEALRSHRFAHAWLISGPEGIGKATFAYRVTRFLLADTSAFQRAITASSLDVAVGDPAARRIAAGAHPDLFVLERTVGKTGKLRNEIIVDDARRAIGFLQATTGQGAWKVLIVDVADELNHNAANALLKIIEEPPGQSLVLLLANVAMRVPATIRSRCRLLQLSPLTQTQIMEVVASLPVGSLETREAIAAAAAHAKGSVKRALRLLEEQAAIYAALALEALEAPAAFRRAYCQKLLAKLGPRTEGASYDIVFDTIFDWLQARAISQIGRSTMHAQAAARLWIRIDSRKREAEIYNLDKRALVLTSLNEVAELAS